MRRPEVLQRAAFLLQCINDRRTTDGLVSTVRGEGCIDEKHNGEQHARVETVLSEMAERGEVKPCNILGTTL
jgi:hypothetical protein